MTLTDIVELIIPPPISIGSYTSVTIDAEGEKAAVIFQIPKTGTLKSVALKFLKITTGTISYQLETVDSTTGYPTGTLYVANASGSVSVDANGVWWLALNGSTGVSVTVGDIVAIVMTQGSVGSHQVYVANSGMKSLGNFPYYCYYISSAWGKATGATMTLEYSDSIITPLGAAPATTANTTFSYKSSTNPNIRGNRFRLPFGARLIGISIAMDNDYNCELKVYDSDGYTVLSTVSIDSDIRGGTSTGYESFYLSSPLTLTANAWYRIALKATVDTGNISLGYVDVSTIGTYDGLDLLSLGTDCIYTACNGDPDEESDWTQTDGRRASVALVIDQIDITAGGGACTSMVVI